MSSVVGLASGWYLHHQHTVAGESFQQTQFSPPETATYRLGGHVAGSGEIRPKVVRNGQTIGQCWASSEWGDCCKTVRLNYGDELLHYFESTANLQSGSSADAWLWGPGEQASVWCPEEIKD